MPLKDDSKAAFLRFFDAGADDPRRSRGGVYASTLFTSEKHKGGEDGASASSPHRSVLVLALDMRWFKDPYSEQGGDFLGEEQWTWLQDTLLTSTADAHVRSVWGVAKTSFPSFLDSLLSQKGVCVLASVLGRGSRSCFRMLE
jgi:hypothetical protein